MGKEKPSDGFFVKELNAYHEKHPVHQDVYYVERFCACGSIRRIRAHKADLWNKEETGIIDQWEKLHSKPPHGPTTEAEARKQHDLHGAFRKAGR